MPVPNIRVNDSVQLTDLGEGDIDRLVELLNNPKIYRFTLSIPYPYLADDARNWLADINDAEEPVDLCWAIRNTADSQLIGACGLQDVRSGHRAEIGYWLGEPYWGGGLMTETVGALTDYGFAELNLVRIFAHVFEGNPASERVLEKNGYQREGCLSKHIQKDGHFLDSHLFAKLRPDAEAR